MTKNSESNMGSQEVFHPNLVRANEAAILKARPSIIGARAKVWGDEQQIYQTLATELLEESIAQRMLADRHGISLPVDAGANAIEKIKGKYFSKMDKGQMVDSFKNITSKISQRRQEDPKYVDSQQYVMDTYWLMALLQRMQDTRFIDDPQGEVEKMVLDTIGAAGLDVGAYTKHIADYRESDRGRAVAKDRGLAGSFDLDGILRDGSRSAPFKEVLSKIGLTVEMLNSVLSSSDVNDLTIRVGSSLTDYDLKPIGISGSDLKGFIRSLPNADAGDINNLKSIIS